MVLKRFHELDSIEISQSKKKKKKKDQDFKLYINARDRSKKINFYTILPFRKRWQIRKFPRDLKESGCCVSSKLYSWWCPVNHRPTRGTDASGRFYKVGQNFFVGVTDPTLGIYTSVVHYDIQYPTAVMAVKVPFRGNLHVYHDLASKSRETQPETSIKGRHGQRGIVLCNAEISWDFLPASPPIIHCFIGNLSLVSRSLLSYFYS